MKYKDFFLKKEECIKKEGKIRNSQSLCGWRENSVI